MNRIHTFRLGPPPADQGLGAMLGWIVAVIVGGFAVLIGALFALFAGLAVAIVAGFAWLAVMLARLTGRRPSRSQPAQPGLWREPMPAPAAIHRPVFRRRGTLPASAYGSALATLLHADAEH